MSITPRPSSPKSTFVPIDTMVQKSRENLEMARAYVEFSERFNSAMESVNEAKKKLEEAGQHAADVWNQYH